VAQVINEAGDRLRELTDTREHLEDIERQTYRFEMRLPDAPQTAELELERAISDATEGKKSKAQKTT
jgi:hypothetical protein